MIDGSDRARFQIIRPDSALLAAYCDPATLAPVASSGNQLIFVNFEDTYDPTFGAAIGSTTWNVSATRANGAGITATPFTSNGVTVSDLASVAGAGVNGAAGSVVFVAQSDGARWNRARLLHRSARDVRHWLSLTGGRGALTLIRRGAPARDGPYPISASAARA